MLNVPLFPLRLMGGALLFALLASRPVLAAESPRLVAVLPLADMGGTVDRLARDTIEETIRTVGGDLLNQHGYVVLTGENTLRILADNGVDSSKACETECALAAARELKASLFISGSASRLEGQVIVFIRLYSASSGAQLGSIKIESDTIKGVRAGFEEKAPVFFERIWRAPEGTKVPEGVALESPATSTTVLAGDRWSLKFESPNPKEPWSLLDAKLSLVCQTLPCQQPVTSVVDYRFRRGASQKADVLNLDVKANLDDLGFARGISLHTVARKDWGKAAVLGYGIVGGSVLGASMITGLIAALAQGWRPDNWWDSRGYYFWGIAGVGLAVAAAAGSIVFAAVEPLHVTIEPNGG